MMVHWLTRALPLKPEDPSLNPGIHKGKRELALDFYTSNPTHAMDAHGDTTTTTSTTKTWKMAKCDIHTHKHTQTQIFLIPAIASSGGKKLKPTKQKN